MYGLFTFFLLLVFVLGIYLLRLKENKWTLVMVGLKVMAAICYVLVYTYYYRTGDIFVYEQISSNWSELASNDYWYVFKVFFFNEGVSENLLLQPRMLFFAKVFHLYYHAFFQNLYLVSIAMTFTGFVFWLGIIRVLGNLMPLSNRLIWVLFFPTILFSTSGINKETLCTPLFFYLAIMIKRLLDQNPMSKIHWVLSLISLFFLYHLRYFYFPFLILWLLGYAILRYSREKCLWGSVLGALVVLLVLQLVLPEKLQVSHFGEQLFGNYHTLAHKSPITSYIDLDFADSSFLSVALAMGQSLKGSFFLDFHSVFSSVASIENIFVLMALLFTVFYHKRVSAVQWVMLLIVVVIMMVLNTSTPNYGTLIRYRVIYWLPFIGLIHEVIKKPFLTK